MGMTIGLIVRELGFRWKNMLLTVGALATAVAICVALAMTNDAAERETRRVTRDIGFNLRIIPRDADETEFVLRGYSTKTMPLDIVHRLAKQKTIAYNHLVATLTGEIDLRGKHFILTGLGDTLFPPGQKKPLMHKGIEPGTVELGHRVATDLRVEQGDRIEIGKKALEVRRVAPALGTRDDATAFVHLSDAQEILGLPGRVSEIQALECLCLAESESPREILQREVNRAAPEAKVIVFEKIAAARAEMRQMVGRFAAFTLPLVVGASAVWVAVMTMLNVRGRRGEIGLLKSLGYRGGTIAWLFLGRALIIGVVAAACGSAVGTWLGLFAAPDMFHLTSKAVRWQPSLLFWSFGLTPLFAAIASLLPATLASTLDPAVALVSE